MKKGIIARFVLVSLVLVGAPACSHRKGKKPPPHAMQPKKSKPKQKKSAPKMVASEKKKPSDKQHTKR